MQFHLHKVVNNIEYVISAADLMDFNAYSAKFNLETENQLTFLPFRNMDIVQVEDSPCGRQRTVYPLYSIPW